MLRKLILRGSLLLAFVAAAGMYFPLSAAASPSVPQRIPYSAHLLNREGTPLTSTHTIRMSFWKTPDALPGDLAGSGAINLTATGYVGWQEVHTVNPQGDGYFTLELGNIVGLPDFSTLSPWVLQNLHLQVEVKPVSAAPTAFELLDVDPGNPMVDRAPIRPVVFALNADLLDQREPGTGSGAIPVLQSGGLLRPAAIPSGTLRDNFIIDGDDTAQSSVSLQFGKTLAKKLEYDIAAGRFNFNDDVRVQGDLTVTGLINGLSGSNIAGREQVVEKLYHPEYEGASYEGDGSANVGRLLVDHDFSAKKNFYQWTSTQTILQDYDVLLRVHLPNTFLRWDTAPLRIEYRSSTGSITENKLDVSVYDASGALVTLSGAALDLASPSWSVTTLSFSGTPQWTPGGDILIRCRLSARNQKQMQLGSLRLRYVERLAQ